MTDETELRELSERIARLSRRELVRVLDMALDVEDRWREEAQAEYLRQIEVFRELERQRAITDLAGVKREAG